MARWPAWFKAHIAIPQDHGAWVFLFSPLLIGLAAGGAWHGASAVLAIAALAAFLIRQPLTILVKVAAGRRPPDDQAPALFWLSVYGLVLSVTTALLVGLGYGFILALAVPAGPIFAWYLWLVSRREERRQAGLELVATGVLALAAPAALWVGRQAYVVEGWLLWVLVWLQSAASIVYAYLRLEQRAWRALPPVSARWRAGWRALAYTTFNLGLTALLSGAGWVAPWLWLAYGVQWVETLYGIQRPAINVKPARIGLRQLAVSVTFTVIFMLTWQARRL